MVNAADVPVEKKLASGRSGFFGWVARRYTRQGLGSLFLMCAFPLHAWTLILAFRDISWLTERTNLWDAIGVTSYGLVYAFLESVILFAVMALLGYLVPGRWTVERRVALLSVLFLVASIWAMLDQLFFLVGTGLPGWLLDLLFLTGHPLRYFYVVLFAVVFISVAGPAYLLMRSDKALRAVRGLIDRLSILTMFYLVLDVIGLVIVVIRNL